MPSGGPSIYRTTYLLDFRLHGYALRACNGGAPRRVRALDRAAEFRLTFVRPPNRPASEEFPDVRSQGPEGHEGEAEGRRSRRLPDRAAVRQGFDHEARLPGGAGGAGGLHHLPL